MERAHSRDHHELFLLGLHSDPLARGTASGPAGGQAPPWRRHLRLHPLHLSHPRRDGQVWPLGLGGGQSCHGSGSGMKIHQGLLLKGVPKV